MSNSSFLASGWSFWSPVTTQDEGQSLEDSQAGAGNEAMHPAPASGTQQRLTHRVLGNVRKDTLRHIHSPSLGSRSLTHASKGPSTFTHMSVHTHTYSRSPFTTSTQRDNVREVAEADLEQNRERCAKGLAGGCADSSHSSLHS